MAAGPPYGPMCASCAQVLLWGGAPGEDRLHYKSILCAGRRWGGSGCGLPSLLPVGGGCAPTVRGGLLGAYCTDLEGVGKAQGPGGLLWPSHTAELQRLLGQGDGVAVGSPAGLGNSKVQRWTALGWGCRGGHMYTSRRWYWWCPAMLAFCPCPLNACHA